MKYENCGFHGNLVIILLFFAWLGVIL